MKKRILALLLAVLLLLGAQSAMAAGDTALRLQATGFTEEERVVRYDPGESAQTLSVTASGGTGEYSYQWYYTTDESGANVTALTGETSSSFTPDTSRAEQMRFYYCVVTDGTSTVRSIRQPVVVGEAPTVTAYFSLTDDGAFVIGDNDGGGSGEVMAMKKLTVPYFDLGLYGLERFYFKSETYGQNQDKPGQPGSSLQPGTSAFAYGKITDLHLLIYALELHACGLRPEQAGKGYLYKNDLMDDLLDLGGSTTGSAFMNRFWGHNSNLTYYHNYEYPLASTGWGATSDQILLHDGDIVTVSMYSSPSFYGDSNAGYHHLGTPEQPKLVTAEVKKGEELTLTLYRSWGDLNSGGGTVAKKVPRAKIYRANAGTVTNGDVADWTLCGETNASGAITLQTAELEPGTYLFCAEGQKGAENKKDYVSCPGGILVTVTGSGDTPETLYGDVNGDGKIDVSDVTLLQRRIAQLTTQEEIFLAQNADVNGDGKIDVSDVTLLQQRIAQLIDRFPVEKS